MPNDATSYQTKMYTHRRNGASISQFFYGNMLIRNVKYKQYFFINNTPVRFS